MPWRFPSPILILGNPHTRLNTLKKSQLEYIRPIKLTGKHVIRCNTTILGFIQEMVVNPK